MKSSYPDIPFASLISITPSSPTRKDCLTAVTSTLCDSQGLSHAKLLCPSSSWDAIQLSHHVILERNRKMFQSCSDVSIPNAWFTNPSWTLTKTPSRKQPKYGRSTLYHGGDFKNKKNSKGVIHDPYISCTQPRMHLNASHCAQEMKCQGDTVFEHEAYVFVVC